MSLTQDTLHKIAAGVATAVLVALGTTTVGGMVTDAKHDTRIQTIERSLEEVRTLRASLEETNKNVLILTAKIDAEKEYRDVPSN